MLANFTESSGKRLVPSIDTGKVQSPWLIQKLGVVKQVLFWWNIVSIELAVYTAVPPSGSLSLLVASFGVGLLEVIDNTLFNLWSKSLFV